MVFILRRMFKDRKGAESFRLMFDLILLVVLLVALAFFMTMSLSSDKGAVEDNFLGKSADFSFERDMYSVLESSYSVDSVSYPFWYVLGVDGGSEKVVDSLVLEESLDSVFGDGFWKVSVFPATGGSRSYGNLGSYPSGFEKKQEEFEFFIPSSQEDFLIRLEVVS